MEVVDKEKLDMAEALMWKALEDLFDTHKLLLLNQQKFQHNLSVYMTMIKDSKCQKN